MDGISSKENGFLVPSNMLISQLCLPTHELLLLVCSKMCMTFMSTSFAWALTGESNSNCPSLQMHDIF